MNNLVKTKIMHFVITFSCQLWLKHNLNKILRFIFLQFWATQKKEKIKILIKFHQKEIFIFKYPIFSFSIIWRASLLNNSLCEPHAPLLSQSIFWNAPKSLRAIDTFISQKKVKHIFGACSDLGLNKKKIIKLTYKSRPVIFSFLFQSMSVGWKR